MSVFKRRKPEDAAPERDLGRSRLSPERDHLPAEAGYADSGLGVPPFRPAPLPAASPGFKETPIMGRSPFAAPQQTAPAPLPGTVTGPGPGSLQRGHAALQPVRAPEPAERRTLVVGRGISLQGVVQDAERLVVEGTVEATMIHATELSVSPGGVFKGEVEVEDAEIAGTVDGTLTARGNLVVRATGRVLGAARCRRLQVEDGGQITGRIEMLSETARQPERERVERNVQPLHSEAAE